MIGLARFVMRGRLQALLVAVAGAGSLLFSWVSAAAIALVAMRRGPGAGLWLLMWAVFPAAAVLAMTGDSGPLSLLVGTTVLAVVLRVSVSLPLAVLAAVPVGLATGALTLALGGPLLDQVVAFFDQFLTSVEQQMAANGQAVTALPRPTPLQVAGMLGAANGLLSVVCLLLARWWQAALYNPGGFGVEFRALYYPPAAAAAMLLGALALVGMGLEYRPWAVIVTLPLMFAGLGLLHAWVRRRGRGRGLLVGFYLAWMLFDLVKLAVVGVALADSWLRWRQRWGDDTDESGNDGHSRD